VARLLLASGADPNAGYLWEGAYAFTALTGALGEGEDAVNQPRHQFWLPLARLLLDAGADPTALEPAHEFISACLSVDRHRVDALITSDPTVLQQAIAAVPAAILRAAEFGRPEAVRLLAELGFDVNAVRRISALHEAASTGDLAMAELLLSLGADPSLKDSAFDSTPLGWAEHDNHRQIIALLTPVTAPDPG